MKTMSLGTKLLFLPIVFTIGIVALGLSAHYTVDEVKVLGPQYEQIVKSNIHFTVR